MQKWRKMTPLGLVLNLVLSGAGMGCAIYFSNKFVDGFEKRMDKFELTVSSTGKSINEKLDSLVDKQNNDNLLLTRRVAEIRIGCCSELRTQGLPSDQTGG